MALGHPVSYFFHVCAETLVATAVADIASIDVSFVKLASGVSFENAPFEINYDGAATRLLALLANITSSWEMSVFVETPQTGLLDGTVVGLSFNVEGTEPCHACTWGYFGQNQDTGSTIQPPDSARGSVLWDKDEIVYGFYQFHAVRGQHVDYSFAASVSRLVEEGSRLSLLNRNLQGIIAASPKRYRKMLAAYCGFYSEVSYNSTTALVVSSTSLE